MKALVVGMGSMGRRRARLLKQFFAADVCGVDMNEQRREQATKELEIICFADIDEAIKQFKPECALVCTSPLSHSKIITQLLERKLNVFTEINLVSDGYERNVELAEKNGLTLFLSSTQIYRRELAYVTGRVELYDRPLRYRYRVGQYLPDWHPWENFKDFFVGDSRTNGCREIMAIEFPWLERAFGYIEGADAQAASLTSLDLGCPDTYFINLYHEGGTVGQIMVDVVSRKPIRSLEVTGEELCITWNGTPDSLYDYDLRNKIDRKVDTYQGVINDPRYSANIVENAYVDELAAFIKALNGEEPVRRTFDEDAAMLDVIDAIEGECEL